MRKQAGVDVNRNKILLTIQSVLVIVIFLMLISGFIGIYWEGLAVKEADPLSWIYTREKVAEVLMPVLPVLVAGIILTFFGLVKGIRDENAARPARDAGLMLNGKAVQMNESGALLALRGALIIAALVMIAAGVFNGSARDVFAKAVKICTECVGLG